MRYGTKNALRKRIRELEGLLAEAQELIVAQVHLLDELMQQRESSGGVTDGLRAGHMRVLGQFSLGERTALAAVSKAGYKNAEANRNLVSDLRRAGLVERTGETVLRCQVLRITDAGRDVLAADELVS